jgi:hypothetical protein
VFGDAGARVVVEQFLHGPERSVFGVCDGDDVVLLAPAQDYKRALDGDEGLNTGGMGAYTPVPDFGLDDVDHLRELVFLPVLRELAARGAPYRGLLYAGLVDTIDGPQLLEFNVRFGDPETQVILPKLASTSATCCTRRRSGRSPTSRWHLARRRGRLVTERRARQRRATRRATREDTGDGAPRDLRSPCDPGAHRSDVSLAADELHGRSMLVRRVEIVPFECVVRGYLAGSGWREYREAGSVCGVALPDGLTRGERAARADLHPGDQGRARRARRERPLLGMVADHVGRRRPSGSARPPSRSTAGRARWPASAGSCSPTPSSSSAGSTAGSCSPTRR